MIIPSKDVRHNYSCEDLFNIIKEQDLKKDFPKKHIESNITHYKMKLRLLPTLCIPWHNLCTYCLPHYCKYFLRMSNMSGHQCANTHPLHILWYQNEISNVKFSLTICNRRIHLSCEISRVGVNEAPKSIEVNGNRVEFCFYFSISQ